MRDLTKIEPIMEKIDEYNKNLQTINTFSFEQIRLTPSRQALVTTIYRLIDKRWSSIKPYIKCELRRELANDIGLYYDNLKLIMKDIEEALDYENNN